MKITEDNITKEAWTENPRNKLLEVITMANRGANYPPSIKEGEIADAILAEFPNFGRPKADYAFEGISFAKCITFEIVNVLYEKFKDKKCRIEIFDLEKEVKGE